VRYADPNARAEFLRQRYRALAMCSSMSLRRSRFGKIRTISLAISPGVDV
jgi:hypothetical protein